MQSTMKFESNSSFNKIPTLKRISFSPTFSSREKALKWAHKFRGAPYGSGEDWTSHEQDIKMCKCNDCIEAKEILRIDGLMCNSYPDAHTYLRGL